MRKGLAVAAVMGLVACGQSVSSPGVSLPAPKPFHPPSSWGLFVTDGQSFQGSWHLIRLDAGTLRDGEIAGEGHGYAIASADGSTLVEVDYQPNDTASVRVFDARNGTVRASFQPVFADGPVLTPDGSQLLVNDNTGHSYRVFDTRTGRVTGGLESDMGPCCGLFDEWLDPTGSFLYGMLTPGSGYGAMGPVTPVLVRYDLRARRENGRVTLNGVQAGLWQTERMIGTEHVMTSLVPGVALSPDGSQLSVLYADGNRLMSIDTVTMKILASRRVAPPPPTTSWFSLLPMDAEAKYDEGIQWSTAYSPDGRRLVAAAWQTTIDQAGKFSTHGLGIRTIDVQKASVIAQAPSVDAGQLRFAPDGSALYATILLTDGVEFANQAHMVLLRLDTSTLAMADRREFTSPRDILLLAR